ncbi:50S ribosomal protein L32 [Candidatus Uhrbacteria bacterium]|nr:50S ribosomal protein L32 [Candidatus Uhrbacteria bacterium]
MGLPGHRRTSSHKRRRAAHFALKKATIGICKQCQKPALPHQACRACGYYAGRLVLDVGRTTKRLAAKVLTTKKKAKAAPDAS